MKEKAKSGFFSFLLGTLTGTVSTAVVASQLKKPEHGYDPEEYRSRVEGMYALVVRGDVDSAMHHFTEMEDRGWTAGMGLLFWLEGAYRVDREASRESQFIREALTDSTLLRLRDILGAKEVDFIRLYKEGYARRKGLSGLSEVELQSIRETLGADVVAKFLSFKENQWQQPER